MPSAVIPSIDFHVLLIFVRPNHWRHALQSTGLIAWAMIGGIFSLGGVEEI
jgi:hypothetical protein